MGAIDLKDVQAQIANMLAAVEQGDSISILRDGRTIARLEPVATGQSERKGKRLPDLSEFRASLNVTHIGNSVIDLREQERN